MDGALAEVGLTAAQYRALLLLAHGSSVPSRIADQLAVARPSVTALLEGLVARRLVHRHRDPGDGRRMRHELTSEGRQILRRADEVLSARLSGLLDMLPASRRRQALQGLVAWEPALDTALLLRLRELADTEDANDGTRAAGSVVGSRNRPTSDPAHTSTSSTKAGRVG